MSGFFHRMDRCPPGEAETVRYTTRQVPINRDLGQVIAAVKAGRAVVPFWCNVPRLIVNIVPMKLTLLVLSILKEMSPQYVSY